MTENRKKILEMLAENKISADEAYRLLSAMDEGNNAGAAAAAPEAPRVVTGKYLRVTVIPGENADPTHQDRVNVRIPMSMIRAGIKLTSLIPNQAYEKVDGVLKEKGFDFDLKNFKKEDLEELIAALADMEVDVESGHGEKIKVFVE